MAVALIPGAARDPATDAASILAIAPSSSIAQAQFMQAAALGRPSREIKFNGWPEFRIAVSFWSTAAVSRDLIQPGADNVRQG
jgi:DNA-binding MurR/RpiR family transcriptional regulator